MKFLSYRNRRLITVRKGPLPEHSLSQTKTSHTLLPFSFKVDFSTTLASSAWKNDLLKFHGWLRGWYRDLEDENIISVLRLEHPFVQPVAQILEEGRANEHIIILPALPTELPFCNSRRE